MGAFQSFFNCSDQKNEPAFSQLSRYDSKSPSSACSSSGTGSVALSSPGLSLWMPLSLSVLTSMILGGLLVGHVFLGFCEPAPTNIEGLHFRVAFMCDVLRFVCAVLWRKYQKSANCIVQCMWISNGHLCGDKADIKLNIMAGICQGLRVVTSQPLPLPPGVGVENPQGYWGLCYSLVAAHAS